MDNIFNMFGLQTLITVTDCFNKSYLIFTSYQKMNQMLACTIWLLHYTEMRMVGFEVGYTGKYPVGQYTNLHSFVDVKYKSNLV